MCDGSIKYIHRSCILKWAGISGSLDYSKLICSLCNTPYTLPELSLESVITPYYCVNVILYNPIGVSVFMNYLSILYGVHTGEGISERLVVSHTAVQLFYMFLYCSFVRIQNIELYANAAINRQSCIFACVFFYSCYAGIYEKWMLMTLSGTLAHDLMWKEHIRILHRINAQVIKI